MDDKNLQKKLTWILFAVILVILFLAWKISTTGQQSGASFLPTIPLFHGSSNLIAIFFTGLLAGALTCLAVQGGLLASTIAQREEQKLKDKTQSSGNALPILSFLVTKLIAYTILGLLLGLLGSFFKLSISTQIILQLGVGIFMVGTALNLLNIHPIFRYFIIQPPRFLTRMVRRKSKSGDLFAPGMLGAFTVLIPCGTTQAMMALAIASGNPLSGGAILFAFVLGTSPLFFILGYLATRIGDRFQQRFLRIAALAIILLAFFNISNALALAGVNISLPSFNQSNSKGSAQANNSPTINIQETGYSPAYLTIKAGTRVSLHIKNTGGSGCTQSFTIPSLGIQKLVPLGQSDIISFNAPSKPGALPFMCSMGMFRGMINVI